MGDDCGGVGCGEWRSIVKERLDRKIWWLGMVREARELLGDERWLEGVERLLVEDELMDLLIATQIREVCDGTRVGNIN